MTERRLSRRESEIISLVAAGETTKAIAARLRISRNTVNWHVGNAFAKLGASSRAEAVAVALRDGEIDPAAGSRPPGPVPRRPSRRPVALRVALVTVVALALAAQVTVASGTRVDVEVRRESPSPSLP
ncbi:MAG TPA: helix-turn-helix domain-containing protein [Candidatus Limnocylindria bacterium]|nr:helix-turn-helix domain-containing protein [Candidatus Limnocylindria bacterium]